MTTPTKEQIVKLPKWAQEHIEDLARQRAEMQRVLDKFEKAHDTGCVLIQDLVCEQSGGPRRRKFRFHATSLEVQHTGVQVSLHLMDCGIQLSYSTVDHFLGEVMLTPTAFQQFSLKLPKEKP